MQRAFHGSIYKFRALSHTEGYLLKFRPMPQPKNRQEARLQSLISKAMGFNIQVRTEKLLREAGYRAHSGRCRIKGQEVIVLDRDAPISEQIEFLANELAVLEATAPPQTITSQATYEE